MSPLVWIIPSVLAVVGVVFLLVRRYEQARTEAIRHFARTRGFEFREKDPSLTFGTHLFRQGHSKHVTNVLSREDVGAKTLVFDFTFVKSSGKNSHHERQTVAAFHRDRRSLPVFELRPETVFHKIASAMGWKDIDFDNRPEFSNRFVLRGPDETAIRQAFRPDILAFFEKHLGWCVEAENAWILAYRAAKRVKPENFAAFVDDARKIEEALSTQH
jgi:hypothetical protein